MILIRSGWLVIPKYGAPRFRKSKPDLKWDEIAIYLQVRLPEELFTRPTLEATVIVKEEAVTPQVLTPDIVVNTAAAIEQATGMKVELKVVPQEKPIETPAVRKCRVCGCAEENACITEDGPCWWVEQDLCSACWAKLQGMSVGKETVVIPPSREDEPLQDEPYDAHGDGE